VAGFGYPSMATSSWQLPYLINTAPSHHIKGGINRSQKYKLQLHPPVLLAEHHAEAKSIASASVSKKYGTTGPCPYSHCVATTHGLGGVIIGSAGLIAVVSAMAAGAVIVTLAFFGKSLVLSANPSANANVLTAKHRNENNKAFFMT